MVHYNIQEQPSDKTTALKLFSDLPYVIIKPNCIIFGNDLLTKVRSVKRDSIYLILVEDNFKTKDKRIINKENWLNVYHTDDIFLSYSFPHEYWVKNGYSLERVQEIVRSKDKELHNLLFALAEQLDKKWIKENKKNKL